MYLILLMYCFYISVNNADCYLYFYTLLNIKTAHWCYWSCQIFTLQGFKVVYTIKSQRVCHYVNVTCSLQGKAVDFLLSHILPLNVEVNQILFSYFKGYEIKIEFAIFAPDFIIPFYENKDHLKKKKNQTNHFLNRKYDIQPTYVHVSWTIKL